MLDGLFCAREWDRSTPADWELLDDPMRRSNQDLNRVHCPRPMARAEMFCRDLALAGPEMDSGRPFRFRDKDSTLSRENTSLL